MVHQITPTGAYSGRADEVAERLINPETQQVLTRAAAGHRQMAELMDIIDETGDDAAQTES